MQAKGVEIRERGVRHEATESPWRRVQRRVERRGLAPAIEQHGEPCDGVAGGVVDGSLHNHHTSLRIPALI